MISDRLNLDVIGERKNSECGNCLHRGHAINATKICPFSRVILATENLKARLEGKSKSRRVIDVTQAIERLKRVVDGMDPDDERYKRLSDLVAEWESVSATSGASIRKCR